MNDSENANRVIWDDQEWALIAAELMRTHPEKVNSNYYKLSYTSAEIEDAAEQVLPQHRHHMVDSFEAVKRPLFNAFESFKPGSKPILKVVPGGIRADGHVIWSPEEWEAVANEIYELDKTAFDNYAAGLRMSTVVQAQQVLPISRRRNFKQIVSFKPQILKTWDHLKAAKLDQAPPVIVDFPSGPVMEPAPRKQDDNSAIATAMHEAFQAVPEAEKQRKKRVDWSPEEWVTIAREMRRQNPHLNFFASKFAIIDLPAIRDAQRAVLPLERRRNLGITKGLQAPLVAAFAALLEEVNRENSAQQPIEIQEKPAQEVEQEAIEEEVEAPVAEDVQEEVAAVYQAPEPVAAPVQAARVENAFNTALFNAAAPLINFLIGELTAKLAPAIVQMMLPELQKSIAAMIPKQEIKPPDLAIAYAALQIPVGVEKVPEVAHKRFTAQDIAAFNGGVVTKPKKLKIAFLGPAGRQKTDLEHEYPDYRLVFVDHGNGIKEAATDCELFLVYNSHLNSKSKADIKKYVPTEKVKYIEGSLSMVKHQIRIWEMFNNIKKH